MIIKPQQRHQSISTAQAHQNMIPTMAGSRTYGGPAYYDSHLPVTWAERWNQVPHSSLTYKTALTKPPNGRAHPTFLAKQKSAKFSCLTLSSMYRIITSHAFIEACMQQFFPQHTQEQVACICGEPIQTIEHVLLVCLLYTAMCHTHLTASSHP